MKRIFSIMIISVFLLTLSACGKPNRSIEADLGGEIHATDGQRNYIAAVTAREDSLTLTLSAPESVAGVSYIFRGGELRTALNGLECVTSVDDLPSGSVVSLLYELYSHPDDAEFQSASDGADTFTLHTKGGIATVTAQDGKPQSISRGNTEIKFR